MGNLTEAIVKEKLIDWTSSTKVQEVLGLTSVDEAVFKKELSALEAKGIIERSGAKKGLKFKYNNTAISNTTTVEVKKEAKEIKETSSKTKSKPKVNIEDIPCEVVNMDRHEFTDEVNNVSINKLFTFITRNPGEHNYSMSFKRTTKGICVKTYRDIFMLSEVLYTKESFMLLLKASGITLE